MLLLIFFLTCILGVLGLSAIAAWSDIRAMVIDNIYSLIIAAAFFVCYGVLFLSGKADIFAPLWAHLAAGLVMFLITLILFTLRMLGGADSKIASALTLWVGLKGLPVFLVVMTIIGGILGVISLLLARYPIIKNPQPKSWITRAQNGESKVPYGVAIAGGALAAFMQLGYLELNGLTEFLVKG